MSPKENPLRVGKYSLEWTECSLQGSRQPSARLHGPGFPFIFEFCPSLGRSKVQVGLLPFVSLKLAEIRAAAQGVEVFIFAQHFAILGFVEVAAGLEFLQQRHGFVFAAGESINAGTIVDKVR